MGVERFLDTRHAVDRKLERSITLSEIRHVIAHVFHEKRKDEFKEDWNAWNYAIRGKYLGAS
jgi:Tfp pilus assembly ATPase PilU